MTIQFIVLLLSLAFVVFGADLLVDGASALARKAGISEFVIGLTIVGFGTSCPELVVSLTGAIQGNADISVGNVLGSNIFNTLLVLGLTALLMPVAVTRENRRRDIPIMLLVTFLLIATGMSRTLFGIGESDSLTFAEGVAFLLIFVLYLIFSFKTDSGFSADESASVKEMKVWAASGLTLLGLAMLTVGGHYFVESAENLARAFGVSDKFIAVTLLAGGTSLPELATSIVAAAKKKSQLALGNILGSNVFNILLILGISALVNETSFAGISLVDAVALIASAVCVWLWSYTGHKDRIDRWEGALMLAGFVAYYLYLFGVI